MALDRLHLTLAFVGSREPDEVRALLDVGRSISQRIEPFSLRYRSLGTFPKGRREPRILWAGLNPSDPLVHLTAYLSTELTKVGLATDGKKFSPHITLARRRQSHKPSRDLLEDRNRQNHGWKNWQVRELYLVESLLKPSGPIYKVRGSWTFSAGSEPRSMTD